MKQNDRERVLMNIAAMLAQELCSLSLLPAVQDYYARSSMQRIGVESGWLERYRKFSKGDIVLCQTSVGRQENPFVLAVVAEDGFRESERGLLLRAIGTDETCWYGNETFAHITGIPERLLWEGVKKQIAVKIGKAFRKLDDYSHLCRGIEFPPERDDLAHVYVGERWGGLKHPTRPYVLEIVFSKRTGIKAIIEQMLAQGFGKREFELIGDYKGPMEGIATITRESMTQELEARGIEL